MKRSFGSLFLFASMAIGADTPPVYIASSETVNASNFGDKTKHIDFGSALTGAPMKKSVPVVVVTDPSKSTWTINSISSQREDSTGTEIGKLAFPLPRRVPITHRHLLLRRGSLASGLKTVSNPLYAMDSMPIIIIIEPVFVGA